MRNLKYEIDAETFAIRVWDLDNANPENAPFHLQETWPDNTPWASYEEAEKWALDLVAMMNDRKNGRPGSNPSEPHIAWKPEDDEPIVPPHLRQASSD